MAKSWSRQAPTPKTMITAQLAMPVALKAALSVRVAIGPRLEVPSLRSFRIAQVRIDRKVALIPTTKTRLARSGQRIRPVA